VAAVVAEYRRPGARRGAGVCIVEGTHLIAEALAAGLAPLVAVVGEHYAGNPERGGLVARLSAALARPADVSPTLAAAAGRVWTATDRVFAALSDVPAPQGILALFRTPAEAREGHGAPGCVLALDGVQDPGNVGALARALLAFAGSGALLLCGAATADPFGEKALRASTGASFHLRHRFAEDLPAAVRALEAAGTRWWGLCPRGGAAPRAADLSPPLGLVVGSEGRGVSPAVLQACAPITVPMPGPTESLNAAVAGGIVLYEAGMRRVDGAAGPGGARAPRAEAPAGIGPRPA